VQLRHLHVVEAAVPALVGAVIIVGELLSANGGQPAAIGLGVAAAASLWGRRRWPAVTLAVSGALVAVLFHIDQSAAAIAVLAPAVALYSLALSRGRAMQILAATAAVGAVILADAVHSGRPTLAQTVAHVLLVSIPLLAAEAIRAHRSYLVVLEERVALAERTREQEAERRAEQERIRIARELHDVVAHTLTEINVQAAAAAERAEDGEARTALERIESTSHTAIAELRAILGVLRDPEQRAVPLAPAPGMDGLADMIDRTRDAGLRIDVDVRGKPPTRLSDASSLAAYRIVQESLTNARRHAPGATVRVRLDFDADRLAVAIENTAGLGRRNGSPPGVGILGMRERAAAIGGSVRAEPTTNGFAVHAELPYEPAP
jgi:signal transduction histidine kinase